MPNTRPGVIRGIGGGLSSSHGCTGVKHLGKCDGWGGLHLKGGGKNGLSRGAKKGRLIDGRYSTRLVERAVERMEERGAC